GPVTQSSDGTGSLTISDLAAGSYTAISVETPDGCMSDNTVTANIQNLGVPSTPVLAAVNNPICEGDTLTINVVSPVACVTYDWSAPSGGTYLNDTTYVVNSTSIRTDIRAYKVKATEDGCTATSNVFNNTIKEKRTLPTEAALALGEVED